MPFLCFRTLLVLCAVVSLAPTSAVFAAGSPSAEQIARWIKELGADSFAAREKASRQLWLAGEAAETALENALQSGDKEVVRRARDILEKFRWGIYPDTPAEIVTLIERYKHAEGDSSDIIEQLLGGGPKGLRAVQKIATAVKGEDKRKELAGLVSKELSSLFLQAVTKGNYASFEHLLKFVHEDHFLAPSSYAAYWLLRGKLGEHIAHFRARLKQNPHDKHCAVTLAYLYRAAGNLSEARKAAEQSGRAHLIEGILIEMADWKTLAARPMAVEKEDLFAVEKWSLQAAYARLAGDRKRFAQAVSKLRELGAKDPSNSSTLAEVFFLNDEPIEGLAQLTRGGPADAFEILWGRLQYREALELAKRCTTTENTEPKRIEILHARALYLLGEKDKAREMFRRFGARIKDGVEETWVSTLIEAEHRLGFTEEAFDHYARLLDIVTKDGEQKRTSWKISLLSTFFPRRGEAAEMWWRVLSQKLPEETPAGLLKRLRELMDGKIAAKEIQGWIEEVDRRLALPTAQTSGEEMALQRLALAEGAAAVGLEELAAALFVKADTSEALLKLGDRLAARNEWAKAAERYRQAWRKRLTTEKHPRSIIGTVEPLPLYLAGHALVQAGRAKEGRALMEQAHWLPLDDVDARYYFQNSLAQRGHKEDARREMELMFCVGKPGSFHSASARCDQASAAAAHKEYIRAAEGLEQWSLSLLPGYHPFREMEDADEIPVLAPGTDRAFTSTHLSISISPITAYLSLPAEAHQMRAAALIAAGKIEEARKHIDLAMTDLPGEIGVPIQLVPLLERSGHKREAEELFRRCYGTYTKLCRDYPRCASAHHAAALLSACCRRNLDEALKHAEKSVELAPTDADNFDALAEVHFQRGDKDKAIAAEKRAIELEPKKNYYRKQRKRMQAGDPSAERPPMDEN